MPWIIKITQLSFRISIKKLLFANHAISFCLTLSEMGISPILLAIIISFSILFIVTFGFSSKNMDSDGIMNWMMKKPEDWIGNKKS